MPTDRMPEASLSDLFLSLSAAALSYLGHEVLPGQKPPPVNLAYARHTISTLEMLRAKTEGNRTEEETRLLNDILYQLRLAFIRAEEEAQKQSKPAAGQDTPDNTSSNQP